MRPMEGARLGERYRLVRRLAVGGMGEVWVAFDETLRRDVAVKVLREEYTGNEDFLRRLRTEARNSSTLVHRNIAQMYDYGEERGAGFLVMELVLGEPLADLLEREPVLAPARLLPILSQTARGLHAAHGAQVVHRDVKPGNILLEHSGTVKITDFGVSVAKNQVPMTATGMVMGTAQYLSPEQAVGQPATAASDIYALGVVAYEATAGRRPFTGKTPVDIAIAHVNSPVPPLPTSVHPGLSEVIIRMLEKDPGRRYASADELARLLDSLATEIAADPFGTARYTSRRSRRESAGATADPQAVSFPPTVAPARASGHGDGQSGRGAGHGGGYGGGHASGNGTPFDPHLLPPRHASPSGRAVHQHTPPPAPLSDAGAHPGAPIPPGYQPSSGYIPSALGADAPSRSYPSRREVQATTRSDIRRVQPARPGASRGPHGAGKDAPTASGMLDRLRESLGGRLSWPLVALVGLLLVVLVASLLAGRDEDEAAATRHRDTQGLWKLNTENAETMVAEATSSRPDSGMMLPDELRDGHRVATTPKDV